MQITINRSTVVTTKLVLDINKLKAKEFYAMLLEHEIDTPQMNTKTDLEKFFKDPSTSAEEVFDLLINSACYASKSEDYSDESNYWIETQ